MAGIYIHIPFCKTRCIYCDFYSTTESQRIDDYIAAVCRELEIRKDCLKRNPVQTVYFGGGTPSMLSRDAFSEIFETISNVYGMADCTEVTIEANPDDLSPEYLTSLSGLPFNRVSIGVQTFDDDILALLNRRHNSHQAIEAVHNCRQAGFRNTSIDLIYGLPGQSVDRFARDLDMAISLRPEHISAYHLTYEEDTILYKMRSERKVAEADEDTSNRFFETLTDKLGRAGYEHYEISNFCLPGFYSRHNSSYWDGTIYMGCGPSAHSYDGESREWNTPSLSAYIQNMALGQPNAEKEMLDTDTRYNDLIVVSLRTRKGLSLSLLLEEYGAEYYNYCMVTARKYLNTGLLEITDNRLRLTSEGIFVSDGIMSELLRV